MAEKLFALTAGDIPRVKRLLDAFEAGELNRQDVGGRRLFQNPVSFEFGFTNETIGANSTGEVSLYVSTGDTGKDVGARSIRTINTTSNTKIKLWRHQRSGELVFDAMAGSGSPAAVLLASVNESTGVVDTDATFAVDNVAVLSPAGAALPASSLGGVNNILRFPSTNNSQVLLFRDGATTTYYAIPHPQRTACT